ncbi:MAG: pectate lyase [Planctomycetota bacterium]
MSVIKSGKISSLDEGHLVKVVAPLVDVIDRPGQDHATVEGLAELIARQLLSMQWPGGGWPCDWEPRDGPYNPNCQFNDNAMLSAMRSLFMLHRVMPWVDAKLTDDIERSLLWAWQFVERCYDQAARPGLPPVVNPLGTGATHRPTEPGHVLDLLATEHMRRHALEVACSKLTAGVTAIAALAAGKFSGLLDNAEKLVDLDGLPGDGNMPRYMVNDKNWTAWWLASKATTYAWRWHR